VDRGDRSARLERLAAVSLFAECSTETLNRILDVAGELDVEAGHVLVERGQPGSGLFVIEEGEVSVALGSKKITMGPGDFFGELALLDDSALRTARVSASTPVRGLAIGRDDFDRLLHSEPSIAIAMLKVLARRLVER
jgi:CRP/FNR family cyclic AMP-dependent transcriptional regulator